jgi:SNF2 family DNA or RNA helicase
MMSNVIGGVTDNANYMVSSTADVIKNDISELHSHLQKIDPARYNDRDAFMRQYGVNTDGAKEALKREMVNRVMPFKIEPKVRADKREISVEPSAAQHTALSELDKNIGKVRMARMEGKVDVAAMKAISPGQFKDAPEAEHEAIAKALSQSLGIIKGSAVRAIIDAHPESAKIDALAKIANERRGKPGVVFAHSLEAVKNIKARLEKEGHRVMTLTGADSSQDKTNKIRGFNPDKGERTHDIMVASDAGATGANLQSGQWLTQFDTSHTAMTHAQRNGRIHRIGQQNDVELLDLVANHPSERTARERLKTKYALRELMSSSMEGLDDSGLASFLHERKVQKEADSLF